MATKKIKIDKEAISEILVADADSESDTEASNDGSGGGDNDNKPQQMTKQRCNKWHRITNMGTISRKEQKQSLRRLRKRQDNII